MSDVSAVLALPYIQPSQAQKHVTHNEAVRLLDMLVQLAVEARDLDTPPSPPVTGTRYIVGAGASGDWAGQAGAVALREEAGWFFAAPRPGWQAHVIAEGVDVVYDATNGWVTQLGGTDLSVQTLGVNTGADATNRLAVASEATLLTHTGGDHQLKINKAGDTDTASLLFQSNWTGHAEMGLAGDTDFAIKVSADGGTWAEALRVDAASAIPQMPQGAQIDGLVTGDAVQADLHDATDGRLMAVGAFGLGQDGSTTSTDLNTTLATGFYNFSNSDPAVPGTTGGSVIVVRYSSKWVSQLAFAPNETFMWLRWTKDKGVTWSTWSPVMTTANIVGTVSETGGDPTGAVIERGSTGNGDYVRYADGTQICTLRDTETIATTAAGAVFRDATLADWSFPAGFVAAPVVSIACEDADCWADTGAVSASGAARIVWSASATATSTTLHAQAIGRWF